MKERLRKYVKQTQVTVWELFHCRLCWNCWRLTERTWEIALDGYADDIIQALYSEFPCDDLEGVFRTRIGESRVDRDIAPTFMYRKSGNEDVVRSMVEVKKASDVHDLVESGLEMELQR